VNCNSATPSKGVRGIDLGLRKTPGFCTPPPKSLRNRGAETGAAPNTDNLQKALAADDGTGGQFAAAYRTLDAAGGALTRTTCAPRAAEQVQQTGAPRCRRPWLQSATTACFRQPRPRGIELRLLRPAAALTPGPRDAQRLPALRASRRRRRPGSACLRQRRHNAPNGSYGRRSDSERAGGKPSRRAPPETRSHEPVRAARPGMRGTPR
jgi:hypothetical protein